jgi:hypothetical protein
MSKPTLSISKSEIDQFYRIYQSGKGAFIQDFKYKDLRMGQAFHQHFKLEKITGDDKFWCDKLYEADGDKAKKMIEQITDYQQ